MTSLDSFNDYVKRWRGAGTVLFASDSKRSIEAVIDYHPSEISPSWCTHRVQYFAELSREATAWKGADGRSMSQMDFAEFLEEHVADVVNPPGALLLEQALKLQILRKVAFGSAARLQSGEFQLNWSQENDKGTVELPERIEIGIPLFHKGKGYKITARLRYRLNEGTVTFSYRLNEFETSIEHAFDEVVKEAIAGTAGDGQERLPLFRGSRTA